MSIPRYDLIVVGAGPAGLCGAIEAAKAGMRTVVFDENARPGGQLFKQIHKFFGSKEHMAKVRGFHIGEQLLEQAKEAGVEVELNATVLGLYPEHEVTVMKEDGIHHYRGANVLIAAGARENSLPFRGWTKPGVMGAGAAQTMIHLYGVTPGKRALVVGSGNVGLVVSYQLLQAGMEVAAIVDAAPRIGGYGVHASKVTRTGVPILVSHTVLEAKGEEGVEQAVIAEVDEHFQPIPGTEQTLDVDTICLAVGLSPMNQLMKMAGCQMDAGIPVLDENLMTSIPGIYSAGDAMGIEEASSAMIEGRMAGLAAANRIGFLDDASFAAAMAQQREALERLRKGMFAPENRGRTDLTETDEHIPLSQTLLKKGFVTERELEAFPGYTHKVGVHPVIECTQNIPCNPCQDACRFGCIAVGEEITQLPAVQEESKCVGCGMCVASCSGQAIFLVNEDAGEDKATVTLPYEFLPYPEAGARGAALDRSGKPVCEAEVISCKVCPAFDHTALLTISVPKAYAASARFFREGAEA